MGLLCLLWELTGNKFSPGSSGDDGDLSQKSLLHASGHLTLHLAAGGRRLHLPDTRKKSLRFGCRATGKNFERGGHKESHRQKPLTSKQPRVECLAAALMFPQHKALLSLLSWREAGGGSGSPANAAASADLFLHSPVIRARPEQIPRIRGLLNLLGAGRI